MAGRSTLEATKQQQIELEELARSDVRREADRAAIESMASKTFSLRCAIDYRKANLCRAELLVEIEGLAD